MPSGCKRKHKRRMDERSYEEERKETETYLLHAHARTHALPTFTPIPRPIASRLHPQLAPSPRLTTIAAAIAISCESQTIWTRDMLVSGRTTRGQRWGRVRRDWEGWTYQMGGRCDDRHRVLRARGCLGQPEEIKTLASGTTTTGRGWGTGECGSRR